MNDEHDDVVHDDESMMAVTIEDIDQLRERFYRLITAAADVARQRNALWLLLLERAPAEAMAVADAPTVRHSIEALGLVTQ